MSVKLKALAADSDDANISVCGPRLTPIVDVWGHDWHDDDDWTLTGSATKGLKTNIQ